MFKEELEKTLTDHRIKWLNMLSELNDELISVPEMLEVKANIIEEAFTSIINLVDKELPNCDSGCKHKDTHQGHGTIWWQGYNQAINDMRAIIRKEL